MASEYLQWKYRDVKPEEKPEYSPKEKRRNWLHYHKWWILLGVLLLIAAADILRGVLGLGIIRPDYQMAYVGSVPLRDETVSALQSALASLGEDCSGDGRVLFQVNSYVDMAASQDKDAARYAAAAQVRLMADMEDCESYFFLCADPEALQENYQILARQDGALALQGEEPWVISWEKVAAGQPALAELEELSGLYLARRGFWENRVCRYPEACGRLWSKLTEEVEP